MCSQLCNDRAQGNSAVIVCSQLCNDRGQGNSAVLVLLYLFAMQVRSVGRLHPTLGMRPTSPQVCECKCQPAAFENGLPVSNQPGTFDQSVLIAGANTRPLYSAAFVSLFVSLWWLWWLSRWCASCECRYSDYATWLPWCCCQ